MPHVEFCGLKKGHLSTSAKASAGPFVPEVITSQIIFGKYTFSIQTNTFGKSEKYILKLDKLILQKLVQAHLYRM